MPRILGIDTSNYTTSIAVVEDGICILDLRNILKVKTGQRGLRQSEALFQHINNLPAMLENGDFNNLDCICVSTRPRPIEGSYMPVFKAGQSIAESIAKISGMDIIYTTHQEGHIEAAVNSCGIMGKVEQFIAIHISGGTTEILHVLGDNNYSINIIGGTKDISIGQFVDRVGVAVGLQFPAGSGLDELALRSQGSEIRIPSKVQGLDMNFSGQETLCLKYIDKGYKNEEIAYSAMLCVAKTLEKIFENIFAAYDLPVILMGGVAASRFLKNYFKNKYIDKLYFSDPKYASDNAVGVALIGYKKFGR